MDFSKVDKSDDRVALVRGRLPHRAGDMLDVEARIDVTAKSAPQQWKPFAPRWDLVRGHKAGTLTDQGYEDQYFADLDQKGYRGGLPVIDLWHVGLKNQGQLVLCCYCPMDKWCHTHLLIDYLCATYDRFFKDGRVAHENPRSW